MTATGVGRLLRFDLRRDRWTLMWWVLGGVLLYWSQAVSTEGLYPTQAEFDKAARAMADNTAFIALAGPARALNTIGGQVTWQASAFGAIVAGLMSMFLVGRHTRAEEESGRDELVRATAVSRHAPTMAAALVVLIANVLFGGLVAASLVGYGLAVAGSVSLGLAATLAGLVFGAVALVAAQVAGSARGAHGITGAVIATSYVLRAVGDVSGGGLSWLSPIGWGQAQHPFSGERWWPALLSVAAVAVLGVTAVRLLDRRDHGAGIRAVRPGPAAAGPRLRGPLGLAWRLQRGTVLGWVIGLALAGLAYGSIGDQTTDLVGDSQFANDLFGEGGTSSTDLFYATMILMLGLLAAGLAISSAGRSGSEERDGRVELLLATALTRTRWVGGHLAVTVAGTAAALLAAGVGLGVGFALATGDWSGFGDLLVATVAYVAPVLVLAALTLLAFGVGPRLGLLGWVGLGYCTVVMLFGELLGLPALLVDLSPFSHLPDMPAEPFQWGPWLALALVATVLGGAGLVAFRRRDIS